MEESSQALFSSAYFGPVHYFAHLVKYPQVHIEAYEHYPKQTFRNRTLIATANGTLPLIIPVVKVNGNHTLIKDVRIAKHNNWQVLHWRAIDAAYSHAPFYLFYKEELSSFFNTSYVNLLDFNLAATRKILQLIDAKNKLSLTQDFQHPQAAETSDFRYAFSPKQKSNINFPKYIQVFAERHEFISNLSILDLLFNLGPETLQYLHALEV